MGYFNPHTREGCDAKNVITITDKNDFNPHTREGCDKCRALFLFHFIEFQSTHP